MSYFYQLLVTITAFLVESAGTLFISRYRPLNFALQQALCKTTVTKKETCSASILFLEVLGGEVNLNAGELELAHLLKRSQAFPDKPKAGLLQIGSSRRESLCGV